MTGFHAAFAEALEGHTDALLPQMAGDERSQAALAVYRNTATKARIDALQANYPTIAEITGEEWFRAAARAFTDEAPGADPAMAAFGEGFPAWLEQFAPARSLPYLAPVARLDRAWTEAHLAPDAALFTAGQAAALGPALAGTVVTLHPSLSLFRFDWSVPSLWLAHRYPEMDGHLEWRPASEALMIWRPTLEVKARRLAPAEHAFLQACKLGRPLAVAGAAAQAGQAGPVDVQSLFSDLIHAGAFAAPFPGIQP
jgi:hypothetical protein